MNGTDVTRRARMFAVALGVTAMLALAASPVLAGGVAVVVPAAGDGRQISANEETALTFTLLQHGVTPVDFGTTTVVVVDTATGESFSAVAKPAGKPGVYRASVTYPRDGWWAWHVEHDGLLVESGPSLVPVVGPGVPFPAYEPGAARSDAAAALTRTIDDRTAERDALQARVADLNAQLAALNDRLAEASGRPTLLGAAAIGLLASIAGLVVGIGLAMTVRSAGGRSRGVRQIPARDPTAAE